MSGIMKETGKNLRKILLRSLVAHVVNTITVIKSFRA